MTISTPRLRIERPTTSDDFNTAEIASNWDKVDAHPGVLIQNDPPAWGAGHAGMLWYEADRGLYWRWTGTAFVRAWPLGWLAGSRRITSVSIVSTTPTAIVSVAATVPAGGRRVGVHLAWSNIDNTVGVARLTLYRDAVLLMDWKVQSGSATASGWAEPASAESGRGGGLSYFESPGEGTFTYSLRLSSPVASGGTSYCNATGTEPTLIDVVEV